ncbi:MAG: hypothetical protein HY619_05075 [Thaumarchaeota archaeon]|nr:hypothetical protein [Nitrososphaerota archaeon]
MKSMRTEPMRNKATRQLTREKTQHRCSECQGCRKPLSKIEFVSKVQVYKWDRKRGKYVLEDDKFFEDNFRCFKCGSFVEPDPTKAGLLD